MRLKRFPQVALCLVAVFALSGCTTIASDVASVAQSLSSSTPSQVTTLADAVSAATLVTQAADIAVKSGKLDRATLLEVEGLNNAIHVALFNLEAANAAGQGLDFAAFNAALSAWNSYATVEGIPT